MSDDDENGMKKKLQSTHLTATHPPPPTRPPSKTNKNNQSLRTNEETAWMDVGKNRQHLFLWYITFIWIFDIICNISSFAISTPSI